MTTTVTMAFDLENHSKVRYNTKIFQQMLGYVNSMGIIYLINKTAHCSYCIDCFVWILNITCIIAYCRHVWIRLIAHAAYEGIYNNRRTEPYWWLSRNIDVSGHQHPKRTVYPKKYAHGFVVLCFDVVMQSFIMNSHEVFIHIHQGCFAGTGAIVRLPQCQWSKPDGYGKISQCITTTKHSKAKTVSIFLGIYCNFPAQVGTIRSTILILLTRFA